MFQWEGTTSLNMSDLCPARSLRLQPTYLCEQSQDLFLKGDDILVTILTLMAQHFAVKTVNWLGRFVGELLLIIKCTPIYTYLMLQSSTR